MSRCLRACLNGGGGPQVGEVTRLSGVTHLPIFLLFKFHHVYIIGGVKI